MGNVIIYCYIFRKNWYIKHSIWKYFWFNSPVITVFILTQISSWFLFTKITHWYLQMLYEFLFSFMSRKHPQILYNLLVDCSQTIINVSCFVTEVSIHFFVSNCSFGCQFYTFERFFTYFLLQIFFWARDRMSFWAIIFDYPLWLKMVLLSLRSTFYAPTNSTYIPFFARSCCHRWTRNTELFSSTYTKCCKPIRFGLYTLTGGG